MTTKEIVQALVHSSYISTFYDRNGDIIEWRETDSDASLAVEFGEEVFEVEIKVRKR